MARMQSDRWDGSSWNVAVQGWKAFPECDSLEARVRDNDMERRAAASRVNSA